MGRPSLEISEKDVEKLANLGVPIEGMAKFFGCSRDTLERRFAAVIVKGKEQLKLNLRAWQIEAASNGNVTMQIWLGKNLSGQSDQPTDDDKEESYKRPDSMTEDDKESA